MADIARNANPEAPKETAKIPEAQKSIYERMDQNYQNREDRNAQAGSSEAVQRAQRLHRIRRKATTGLALRAMVAAFLISVFWFLQRLQLMDFRVCAALTGGTFSWLTFWLGTWSQLMLTTGGR